jgi:hypothetical protein
MGKTRPSCYMCEEPAVSREHVPPECIFPPESALRKNLITVPSCHTHNADKSRDDLLLQCLLASAYNTSPHAYRLLDEIVLPRLERKRHLTAAFMPDLKDLGEHEARFTPDLSRFESSIRAIVRGLYYHEARHPRKLLAAEMKVFWPLLRNDEGAFSPEFMALHDGAEKSLPPPAGGANPEIFQYRIDLLPGGQQQMCRMRFYEGVPVYGVWSVKDAALARV